MTLQCKMALQCLREYRGLDISHKITKNIRYTRIHIDWFWKLSQGKQILLLCSNRGVWQNPNLPTDLSRWFRHSELKYSVTAGWEILLQAEFPITTTIQTRLSVESKNTMVWWGKQELWCEYTICTLVTVGSCKSWDVCIHSNSSYFKETFPLCNLSFKWLYSCELIWTMPCLLCWNKKYRGFNVVIVNGSWLTGLKGGNNMVDRGTICW